MSKPDPRKTLGDRYGGDLTGVAAEAEDLLGQPRKGRQRGPQGPQKALQGSEPPRIYGKHGKTAGGLVKRTVYLSEDELAAIEAYRQQQGGISAAAVVRQAVRELLGVR